MVQAILATARNAHAVLAMERKLIETFLKEAAHFESVGAILNPTLYRQALSEPWRAKLNDMLRAALAFDDAYLAMEDSILAHMPPEQREAMQLIARAKRASYETGDGSE